MFREMRRKAQQISTEECMEILLNAKTGVLGLHGEDGYPYTVPVNFVYTPPGTGNGPVSNSDGSADKGNGSESGDTVIDHDEVMPKERTTKYRSVIAFGRAEFVEGDENLRRAANALGAKYSSGYEDLYMAETEDTIRRKTLCCVEITIDHMTGKIGRELMLERKNKHEND